MPLLYQLPLFALEKRCARCGLVKTIGEFPTRRRTTNGGLRCDFKSLCRDCARAKDRERWPMTERARQAQARRDDRAARTEKRCPHCGNLKPLDAFWRDSRKAQGRAVWCKDCRRARKGTQPRQPAQSRPRPARPPREEEVLAAQGLRRCTKCHEVKPLEAFYRSTGNRIGRSPTCKECWRAAVNARAAATNYAYGRAYYDANGDHLRRRMMERWQANRHEREAQNKRWKAAHPEWVRAHNKKAKARRRALLALAGGTHTVRDILLLYDNQAGCCAYCGVALGQRYTLDHIVPLSRGGSNDRANLCICCKPCNSSKGGRLLSEWSGRAARTGHPPC